MMEGDNADDLGVLGSKGVAYRLLLITYLQLDFLEHFHSITNILINYFNMPFPKKRIII